MPTVNDIYQQVLGRSAEPEGLAYWKSVFGNDVDENELAQFKTAAAPELAQRPAVGSVAELYQQVLGRAPESQAVVDEWTRQFGSTIDANEVAQFRDAAQLEITNPNISNIKGQILAQGTTANWTGQGQGSAEANATDMATILAGIGITDISQFGVLPNGSFGNKVTGQAVPNTYAERQVGNSFGGTFAGSGNTGYRVNFDAAGNPIFYTTAASSSDVPGWVKAALIATAAYVGLDATGLLAAGGAAGGAGTTGLTLAQLGGTAGATALTAAETAALYGTGAAAAGGVAGMGAGTGITAAGAGGLGGATSVAGLGTGVGTGLTTAGAGGLGGATGAVGLGGATGAGLTTAGGLTGTGVLTGSTLGAGLLGATGTTALTGTGVLTGSTLGTQLLGTGAGTAATVGGVTGLTNAANLGAGALTTGVGAGLGTAAGAAAGTAAGAATGATLAGLTPAQLGALISTGLNTGAGLLQQQTSREAALAAQAMIERETAAAKLGAQFRPIGMTTRFGTSNFAFDPVTGKLIDANYNLSPEAKAQQDRLMALSNAGLTQAEAAQAQFAPLQAGAQQMFNLGQGYLGGTTDPRLAEIASQYLALSPESQRLTALGGQYIAQSPEQVAQNYLNQQMALLQPGRELELANLQNKLQQQGRGGLSVAQGGSYGATTPELQALFNARAKQEAELAASAQQAGQKDVLFGAGLFGTGQKLGIEGQQFGIDALAKQQALEKERLALGGSLFTQGATNLGSYYAGQKAAYDPYTAAMNQVSALELAAQQPFTLSTGLAEKMSAAGQRVGEFGLKGAGQSVLLSTGPAATTNPYSTFLSGLGGSPAFGTAAGNALTSLFS
jgi:hypothetical protein